MKKLLAIALSTTALVALPDRGFAFLQYGPVAAPPPPVATAVPQIDLYPEVTGLDYPNNDTTIALSGNTTILRVNVGRWLNSPTSYTFCWHTVNNQCPGGSLANGSNLTINTSTSPLVGQAIQVDVTATNSLGSTTAKSHWFGPISTTVPVFPTAYENSGTNTGQTTNPVEPTNWLENGHAVSPGCVIPPRGPAYTASGDPHVWYFDPIGGRTQQDMITAGVPTGQIGHTKANAFKDIFALLNVVTGYNSQSSTGNPALPLFWTYTQGKTPLNTFTTIQSGDTIYLEPGWGELTQPYGEITQAGKSYSTSDGTSAGTVNFTWIMGDPTASSRPVMHRISLGGGNGGAAGWIFKGFNDESYRARDRSSNVKYAPISVSGGTATDFDVHDVLFEDIKASGWLGHSDDPWPGIYPNSNGTSDNTVVTASAVLSIPVGQDPTFGTATGSTPANGAGDKVVKFTSIPFMGYYVWSPGLYRQSGGVLVPPITGVPSGTKISAINGITTAPYGPVATSSVNSVSSTELLSAANYNLTSLTAAPGNPYANTGALPATGSGTQYYVVAANVNANQTVYYWNTGTSAYVSLGTTSPSGAFLSGGSPVADAFQNLVNTSLGITVTSISGGTMTTSAQVALVKNSVITSAASGWPSSVVVTTGGKGTSFTVTASGSYSGSASATASQPIAGASVSNPRAAHWTGSVWEDRGTPTGTFAPCDPIADANTGCPTSAYVNPVTHVTLTGPNNNVPGCDPQYSTTDNGVFTPAVGGCGTGTPAWNGITRQFNGVPHGNGVSGDDIMFSDSMFIVPAGSWNSTDWEQGLYNFYNFGGVASTNPNDTNSNNILKGGKCFSLKDSIIRNGGAGGMGYGGATDSIAYNNRIKFYSADGIDVYTDHRITLVHNWISDPTITWAHIDGIQFATSTGREDRYFYNNNVIENEIMQWTDLTNPFPRGLQAISYTDNAYWGGYVCCNIITATGAGIGPRGKWHSLVHNTAFQGVITSARAAKVSGETVVLNGIMANNVANAVNRDNFGSFCDSSTGDLLTVQGNIAIPVQPLPSPVGVSQTLCSLPNAANGNTSVNYSGGTLIGVFAGVSVWSSSSPPLNTDWRSGQSGVSSLFTGFNPVGPPQKPATGWIEGANQLWTTCVMQTFPFDPSCASATQGVANAAPNASFTNIGSGLTFTGTVSLAFGTCGGTGTVGSPSGKLPTTAAEGSYWYAINAVTGTGCGGGSTLPIPAGIWQYCTVVTTTCPSIADYDHTNHPGWVSVDSSGTFAPGIVAAGTALTAWPSGPRPIADIFGHPWKSTPSAGAVEVFP